MDLCRNPECGNPAGIDPPGYCSRACSDWRSDTITRLRAELTVADRDAAEEAEKAAKEAQDAQNKANEGPGSGGDDVTLTVGSLFAGIGGFDLGLERAGFKIKWQVEIDPWCQKILEKHWPDVGRHDDVRTFPKPDTERPDVIVGGFPCQDISLAGAGAGLNGTRSGLWWEMLRIIREIRPPFVILENVSALLTRGLGDVLGGLAQSGYDCEWDCIPASAVGAPHRRDRVWIVGRNTISGSGTRFAKVGAVSEGANTDTNRTGGAVSHPKSDARREGSQGCDASRHMELQGRSEPIRPIGRSSIPRQRPIGENWIVEPGVGRVANGIPNRVDRLRGLGNAIVPQIAEWIGRRLIESINATNAEAAKDRQRILDESNAGYSELRAKEG